MAESEQQTFDIPQELLEQLAQGNVVIFGGAGIAASEDGLPSGSQLAHELAKRAMLADVSGMTLPEVAAAYELEMGYQSLIAYVTTRIDDPRYAVLPTHRHIAVLPCKYIITTNWDNLLEDALRQAHKPFVKVVRDLDVAFATEEKVLLVKLHGSIEQKDSIVITGDDYYDVFTRLPETANLVRAYFATKTILFLGFGLADEDFKRLYHEVVGNLGKHKRRAYAVQLNPSPLAVKYWQQKNVQVIAADVTMFLEALCARLRESAPPPLLTASGQTPHSLPASAGFSAAPHAPPKLHHLLSERLNIEELRTLCFDLGVDFDDLPGEGKAAKARELVAYYQRRNQLDRLAAGVGQMRPDIKELGGA